MPLTISEGHEFVAEPHVASVSVAAGKRGPLCVPIWYQYEPATEEQVRELASRYLPREAVEPYVEFTWFDPPDALITRMRPEHRLSSDLG